MKKIKAKKNVLKFLKKLKITLSNGLMASSCSSLFKLVEEVDVEANPVDNCKSNTISVVNEISASLRATNNDDSTSLTPLAAPSKLLFSVYFTVANFERRFKLAFFRTAVLVIVASLLLCILTNCGELAPFHSLANF